MTAAVGLALLSTAFAVEVTDLPPAMKGDVTVGFESQTQSAYLYEGTTTVGSQDQAQGILTFGGTFSPYTGVGVFFDVPTYTGQSLSYGFGHEMVFDPNMDTGTMLDTDELETTPSYSGSGLGGTWIGLKGTPLSQDFNKDHRVTWLLEYSHRFKDESNFWTDVEGGERGAGPGAAANRFRTAVSTTKGLSHPYFQLDLIGQRPMELTLLSDDGSVISDSFMIDPANTAEFMVGTQVVPYTYDEGEAFVAVDTYLSFGYASWQDMPSGMYLPSVLSNSADLVVTQSEHTWIRGGLGLVWRFIDAGEASFGMDVGATTPYRVEHPYDVSTGLDTINVGLYSELRFRARDFPGQAPEVVGRRHASSNPTDGQAQLPRL